MDFHFEDLEPGLTIACGPAVISRDEIVGFAREYDPQPFHVDEALARDTFVGRLIASGWQTCSLAMRIMADDFVLRSSSMGSPGVDEIRWLAPVLPGDALRVTVHVREARPSRTKPDRGLVNLFAETTRQDGTLVMTQAFWVMFGRRGADALPNTPREGRSAPPVDNGATDETGTIPYVEDLVVGSTQDLGRYTFTADAIVRFARAFDPQPFHLSEEAARRTHFGGLCASGWQTASAWMARYVARRDRDRAATIARGDVPAATGPSPGFTDLKWLKPVYAGDTIHYRSTLVDKRALRSRPGWGLVTNYNTGDNQHGERVFEFTGAGLWQCRPVG